MDTYILKYIFMIISCWIIRCHIFCMILNNSYLYYFSNFYTDFAAFQVSKSSHQREPSIDSLDNDGV